MDSKPFLSVRQHLMFKDQGPEVYNMPALTVTLTRGHAVMTCTHGIYGDTANEQQQSRVNALEIASWELTGK